MWILRLLFGRSWCYVEILAAYYLFFQSHLSEWLQFVLFVAIVVACGSIQEAIECRYKSL